MFEKILVCLDGSDLSEQILPYAEEEALRFRGRAVLLHVVSEPVMVTPGLPGAGATITRTPEGTAGMLEYMEKEQEKATTYLERIAGALQEKGVLTEVVVTTGPPGDAIINYANNNGIGLIAIATHGRSGLGRAVFGSVADYVLRESGLPILVIRPKETDN